MHSLSVAVSLTPVGKMVSGAKPNSVSSFAKNGDNRLLQVITKGAGVVNKDIRDKCKWLGKLSICLKQISVTICIAYNYLINKS